KARYQLKCPRLGFIQWNIEACLQHAGANHASGICRPRGAKEQESRMESGPTPEEAAKTTADAAPVFMIGHNTARADLLMLLRAAFADGPLNETARAALRRTALFLGVGEDEIELVMAPLESAGAGSVLLFAAM